MTIPAVSILLPLFESAATIAACLRSIQRQTLRDWQCVLVDDGSTDETAARVASATAGDPRFELIRTPHRGLIAALNTGIDACRGALIARMDGDDVMHRQRLAAQAAMMAAEPHLSAVGCRVRLFPRAHLGEGWREYERWLNAIDSSDRLRRDAWIECPIAHPSLMIRSAVLRQFRYRSCAWAEDYDLILRMLLAGHELSVVPRRLLAWRDSAQRLSRTDRRCEVDSFIACKASFLATSFLADQPSYGLWGYGATGRKLRHALRRHQRELAYVVDVHPGRLGNRIDGAPVIAPDELDPTRSEPLIVSVAGVGPRTQIRAYLNARGLKELHHYLCAA